MEYIEVLSRHRAIRKAFQQVVVLGNGTVLLGTMLPSAQIHFLHGGCQAS